MPLIPSLFSAWILLAQDEAPTPEPFEPPVVVSSSGADAEVVASRLPLPARVLPGTRMMVRSTDDRRTEDGRSGRERPGGLEFLLDRGGSVTIDRERAEILPSDDGVLHVVWGGSFELPIDGYVKAPAPLLGELFFAAGGGTAVVEKGLGQGLTDRYVASDARLFVTARHGWRTTPWSLIAEGGLSSATLRSVEHITPDETTEQDGITGSTALWALAVRAAWQGQMAGGSFGLAARKEEFDGEVSTAVLPVVSGRLGNPRVVALRASLGEGPSIADIESIFDEGSLLELGVFHESDRFRVEAAVNGYSRVLLRPAFRWRRVWTHLEVSAHRDFRQVRSATAGVRFAFGLPK